MTESYFTLYVDEKTLGEINSNSKGLFAVPLPDENDTLYEKSEAEKKWRELLEVRDTKLGPSKDDKNTVIFTVQYRAHEDGYEKPNKGRVLTKNYWVNMAAVKDPQHEEHKRSLIAMSRLTSLCKACGITLEKDETGQVPYHIYFNGAEGGEKPLVKKMFWGIIRAYQYTNRRTNELVDDQDVDKFIPLDK